VEATEVSQSGGPLPWEVQAAGSRLHQTNTSALIQSYGVSELLQEMRFSHGRVCDAASHINSRYGPEVLVATGANFCKLVLLHKFIRDIILHGDASNLLNCSYDHQLHIATSQEALVRKRTLPTERPPLVGEVSANFC
jgi:hypothetical protein